MDLRMTKLTSGGSPSMERAVMRPIVNRDCEGLSREMNDDGLEVMATLMTKLSQVSSLTRRFQ